MAVAFLMAMTSTLSAQMEGKGSLGGASTGATTASSASFAEGESLSGSGSALMAPPYAGWCGTPDHQRRARLAHLHAQWVAVMFRSGFFLTPGTVSPHLVMRAGYVSIQIISLK